MIRKKYLGDSLQQILAWLAVAVTVTVCCGIIGFLFVRGYKEVSLDFITNDTLPASGMAPGILSPLIGTFLVTLLGISIALPWALAVAIFLSEYAGRNRAAYYFRVAIDVLAGVPTIVIAIFGLAMFSRPSFGFMSSMVQGVEGVHKAFGRSFLVCGVGMAIMILPFVIKTCEEAIKAVPSAYREASLALGATKWHTTARVVLLSARKGIATSVILGMGRIIGDTAIVWLLLGGSMKMTGRQPWWQIGNWLNTLKNTGATLTTYIYFNSPAGEGNKAGLAFGASLVLIAVILLLNAVVDVISAQNTSIKE